MFEQTHILKIPMLTELRDYAYEYGRLCYEGFSNGIVSGCAISTTKDTITLNRGMIRYGENLYLITEPISLAYYPTDVWTVFKLEFKDEIRRDGYIYREVETALTDRLSFRGEEMELCRFKLKAGARLRMEYVDFTDRGTEFDTVNTIHAPFAAFGKSSISPDITRAFAMEASPCALAPIDAAFAMQALAAAGAMNRDAIILYIAEKLKREIAEYTNQEIFASLKTILGCLKQNGNREIPAARRSRRQLIVD